jgi:hypothetical protein
MSVISNSIRVAICSIALVGILSPPTVLANSGLVVKLLDGSVPINQPDLFANAYSKAWNPDAFCNALKAVVAGVAAHPDNATVITSCSAPAYGVPSVVSHGALGAYLDYSVPITLEGTAPWAISSPQGTKQVTCQFTDQIELVVQDELKLSESAAPPNVPSVSVIAPTLRGTVSSENWGTHCTDTAGNHPGGVSDFIISMFPTATSDANFPGGALSDAFSPYQATIEKDLVGGVYNVSVTTGDVDIQVINTFLREELGKPLPRLGQTAPSGAAPAGTSPASTSPGSAVAASAWGTQVSPSTSTLSGTTPNWGAGTSTATAPIGAGSTINRSIGSSLQQERAQQTFAAPSSLGQH